MANKIFVGGMIKNIRISNNLTVDDFAKKLRAKRSNVIQWEQGKYLPSKRRLEIIANMGGVSLGRLLYNEDDLDNYIFVNFDKDVLDKLKVISIESGDSVSEIVNFCIKKFFNEAV